MMSVVLLVLAGIILSVLIFLITPRGRGEIGESGDTNTRER